MARRKDPAKELETAERDRRIIELRRLGFHYDEIGREVNLTAGRCCQIYKHHLRELPAAEAANARTQLAEDRAEEVELATGIIRRALAVADNEMTTPGTRVRALEAAIKGAERRSKIRGTEAPVRRELEMVDSATEDARLMAEISEMEAQLRAEHILNGDNQ